MEEMARLISIFLSTIAELVAAVVIAMALGRFIYNYMQTLAQAKYAHDLTHLRVTFGSSLTLALEILLAADILVTAVAPSWNDIGKLAAIAAIRTALNYFLEKELAANEARQSLHQQKQT